MYPSPKNGSRNEMCDMVGARPKTGRKMMELGEFQHSDGAWMVSHHRERLISTELCSGMDRFCLLPVCISERIHVWRGSRPITLKILYIGGPLGPGSFWAPFRLVFLKFLESDFIRNTEKFGLRCLSPRARLISDDLVLVLREDLDGCIWHLIWKCIRVWPGSRLQTYHPDMEGGSESITLLIRHLSGPST